MSTAHQVPSKAAHSSLKLGLGSAVLVATGAALAFQKLVAPFHGFLLMVLGLAMGLAGIVTSLVGLSATRPHKQRHGRSHALRGLVLSVTIVAFVLLPAGTFLNVPRINDITTDVDDPPSFVSAATLAENSQRDMSYPGQTFATQQKQAYPDLAGLVLPVAPDVAYAKTLAALKAMPRMRITGEDAAQGRIEAEETSALFHFGDDIVVRIVAFEGGSKIDVRSKSRNGKGDLGVNAARIRDLFARIKAE